MIRNFLLGLLFLFLFSDVAFAQVQDSLAVGKIKSAETKEIIYSHVKQMPKFPGSKKGLQKYLFENTKYPDAAKKKGITGSVLVRFVVDKKGKAKTASITQGLGNGCDEEALRLINTMPAWKPGSDSKKSVSTFVNLSILFPPNLKSEHKPLPKTEIVSDKNIEPTSQSNVGINPDSKLEADSAFFKTGMEQMKKLDYNSAITSFSDALKLNPTNTKALLLRGIAYYKLKDLDKACPDWNRSVELGNKNAIKMIEKYCKK